MTSDLTSKEQFTRWLCSEMPAGSVIGNPAWWAKRVWDRVHGTPPEANGIKPVAIVVEQLDDNEARVRWIFNPVPEGQELQWDHGPPHEPSPAEAREIPTVRRWNAKYPGISMLEHNGDLVRSGFGPYVLAEDYDRLSRMLAAIEKARAIERKARQRLQTELLALCTQHVGGELDPDVDPAGNSHHE